MEKINTEEESHMGNFVFNTEEQQTPCWNKNQFVFVCVLYFSQDDSIDPECNVAWHLYVSHGFIIPRLELYRQQPRMNISAQAPYFNKSQ